MEAPPHDLRICVSSLSPGDDEQPGSQQEGEGGQQEGHDGTQQQQPGRKKRGGAAYAGGEPCSTLKDAASLKPKSQDITFDADPLFTKTSKLFDENSAEGT